MGAVLAGLGMCSFLLWMLRRSRRLALTGA